MSMEDAWGMVMDSDCVGESVTLIGIVDTQVRLRNVGVDDLQKVVLSEPPSNVVGGESPRTVGALINSNEQGIFKVGNRVEVAGELCESEDGELYLLANEVELEQVDFKGVDFSEGGC